MVVRNVFETDEGVIKYDKIFQQWLYIPNDLDWGFDPDYVIPDMEIDRFKVLIVNRSMLLLKDLSNEQLIVVLSL